MRLRFFLLVGVFALVAGATEGCAAGNPDAFTDDGGGGTGGSGGTVDPACADVPDGTPCGDSTESLCDEPNTCLAGVCSNNFVGEGVVCDEGDGSVCDPVDTCDGEGSCRALIAPMGTSCGDTTTSDCTAPDTCDGMGTCVGNHRPAGFGCGNHDNNQCTDPDTCDGEGNCLGNDEPEGAPCGNGQSTACTLPDSCDGMGTCETHDAAAGTACGNQVNSACTDPDTCDGAGSCNDNHALPGTSCGSAVQTDCNNADTCDGNGMCLLNLEMDGVVCDDCSQGAGLCDTCSMGACLNGCIPTPKTLQTLFAQNNGLNGAMFDVVAIQDIVVTRLVTNLSAGSHNISVWYIAGGKTGHETTMGDWTFVATANAVVSAGTNNPTEIPIDLDLPIDVGERYGLYVHVNPGGTGALRYTDGTAEGAIYVQNTDLRIFEGRGVSGPFFGTFQPAPRIFNGIVKYELPCP